jgi:XapX domain-containing protein
MSSAPGFAVKSLLGLTLAFAIGFACRAFGIPSPAPPVLVGALLVVAMTTGYLIVDRLMVRPAIHAAECGGPSGLTAVGAAAGNRASEPSNATGMQAASAAQTTARLLTSRVIRSLALLGLCAAYLQGGLQKLIDFSAAVAEAQHFGLPLAPMTATVTIVTELIGSLLILSGYYRWIGALGLAGFTFIATFVANRFWEIPLPDRFGVENAFFEHLGLVGGFLLVAYLDLREAALSGVEVNMNWKHSSLGSAIGAIAAALLGIVFFFAIIGVFGLEVAIAALLTFIVLTLLILRRPASRENR